MPRQHDRPHDKSLTGTQKADIQDFAEWLGEVVPDDFWSEVKPPEDLNDLEQESWDMMWTPPLNYAARAIPQPF